MQILLLLLAAYVGSALLVALFQRSMIYHPDKADTPALNALAAEHNLQPWLNAAGASIGWRRAAKSGPARLTALITHGNAGFALHRVDYANALQAAASVDVFILEYPGYGDRPGSPSQQSLFAAADEAMRELNARAPLIVIGESLGTGVAAYLAGKYPERVRAVLLVAPYDSLVNVGQRHLPMFPISLMMRDRFPSAKYLQSYHGPLAVSLGGRDETVPGELGRRLYDGYAGPKRVWEDVAASHADLLARPQSWWAEVLAFWEEAGAFKDQAAKR